MVSAKKQVVSYQLDNRRDASNQSKSLSNNYENSVFTQEDEMLLHDDCKQNKTTFFEYSSYDELSDNSSKIESGDLVKEYNIVPRNLCKDIFDIDELKYVFFN